MDDNKAKSTEKKAKNKKDAGKKSVFAQIRSRFLDIAGEFRKIIWPDRKALIRSTVNVVIISALVGAVILVMDYVFVQGYSLFIKFFS